MTALKIKQYLSTGLLDESKIPLEDEDTPLELEVTFKASTQRKKEGRKARNRVYETPEYHLLTDALMRDYANPMRKLKRIKRLTKRLEHVHPANTKNHLHTKGAHALKVKGRNTEKDRIRGSGSFIEAGNLRGSLQDPDITVD